MGPEIPIETTAAPAAAVATEPAPGPRVDAAHPTRRALLINTLVVLVIALGAWVRVWAAETAGDLADVSAYRDHIQTAVERGLNVYALETKRYPYFPGWLQLEGAVWQLSLLLKLRFWWAIRMVIVAADVLSCFAVWWAAHRAGGAVRGRWAAAIYALSPIAILISGNHGQFDSLPTLFSVVAAGFLLGSSPRPWASGLMLGLAISMKPFPALLVPVFVRTPGLSWRGRLSIVVLAGVVVLFFTLPFLLADAPAVFRQIAGYPGLNDQGLGGLLRSLWLYRANNIFLPGQFGLELIGATRWSTLALMGLVIAVLWRHSAARVAAAVYLAFLSAFGGVSTQYLVWPVAWLLISDMPLIWAGIYSIGAAAGAIGFYMVYWPQMVIPGSWRPPVFENVPLFVGGQIAGLLTTWATFVATLRGGRWSNPAVIALTIAVLVSIYPVARMLVYLAGEFLKIRG